MKTRRNILKSVAGVGAISSAIPSAWIKPIVETVVLPVHAQTSIPMASLFSFEGGLVTPCFNDAKFADKLYDILIYENSSLATEAKIKNTRVGDSNVWNILIEPLIIKPQQSMSISRGFHLPASNPLDFTGSAVDITFVDGSVLSIPAANC